MSDWTKWPGISSTAGGPDMIGLQSLPMLLGRLLERTETFGVKLDKMDMKLDLDRDILREHRDMLRDHHERLDTLEKRFPDEQIPKWERTIKRILTWALPLSVAYGTGSLETVAKIVEALK